VNGGRKPAESSLFPGGGVGTGHGAEGGGASRSSRVLEGEAINTDVTSPGAAIALGLIYIGYRRRRPTYFFDKIFTFAVILTIKEHTSFVHF